MIFFSVMRIKVFPLHQKHASPIFLHFVDLAWRICSYGEFFLNEIIESQNASNKAFVAQVNGVARAFMSVSTDVDLTVLNTCFDLSLFNNLRKLRRVPKGGEFHFLGELVP